MRYTRDLIPDTYDTCATIPTCATYTREHYGHVLGSRFGRYTPTLVTRLGNGHPFGTTSWATVGLHQYSPAIVGAALASDTSGTRLGSGSIQSQNQSSHAYDMVWQLSTYMCPTGKDWQHTLDNRVMTVEIHIVENAHIPWSHGWDVGAYSR